MRINLPNAYYHVLARGNERRPVFRDGRDYGRFVELMGAFHERFEVEIWSYVLRENHFHLVLRPRTPNLSRAVQHLLSSHPSLLPRLMPALDALASDPSPAVRVAASSIALPLLNIDRCQARGWLIPRLEGVSVRTGLRYGRASVRWQATRWGSCSARRTVSLNAKLLLLPPELVDYVLVHELCHLVHMNHSKRFWELVRRFDPECHEHARQVRKLSRGGPRWAAG